VLTHQQAKAYYDRFGSKQDSQAFYEDRAKDQLVAHADFEQARAVYEFGCGTGRFAEDLLSHHLPPTAIYHGIDVSSTMVQLSRERLAKFGDRVQIRHSDGAPKLDEVDHSIDRVVSNYVLDLLVDGDARQLVSEARRVLTPDGRLCLCSLTRGINFASRCLTWTWSWLYAVRPMLVGGCRPIELREYLNEPEWTMLYRGVVTGFGVPSEIIVAVPKFLGGT
jgi:ubiquinone/menaquinone biosynthesis C-methylase UbiE